MTERQLLCCLEERSARLMLDVVLNRILPSNWRRQYIVFEGKKDLLNRIAGRVRGWRCRGMAILVLCDQDAQDCKALKAVLSRCIADTGRALPVKIRIACHELENFYLGDLAAVERGLRIAGLSRLAAKNPYRRPDEMTNAPEQLRKITGNAYQKCAGSQAIAPFLDLAGGNRSASFNALVSAIRELVQG